MPIARPIARTIMIPAFFPVARAVLVFGFISLAITVALALPDPVADTPRLACRRSRDACGADAAAVPGEPDGAQAVGAALVASIEALPADVAAAVRLFVRSDHVAAAHLQAVHLRQRIHDLLTSGENVSACSYLS